ncbi:MAG TPA: hypothetical protein VGE62_03315 [Candidatus Paceibacterota bacterium]
MKTNTFLMLKIGMVQEGQEGFVPPELNVTHWLAVILKYGGDDEPKIPDGFAAKQVENASSEGYSTYHERTVLHSAQRESGSIKKILEACESEILALKEIPGFTYCGIHLWYPEDKQYKTLTSVVVPKSLLW